MIYNKITGLLIAFAFLILISCSSVDSYIEKGDFANAEKHCSELKNEKQNQCFATVADSYFKIKDYSKAASTYKRIGNNSMFEKSIFENAMEYAARKEYEKAGQMFCSIKKYDWFKNIKDDSSKEIKQLMEFDNLITEYNKIQDEKRNIRYFAILKEMKTTFDEVNKVSKEIAEQKNVTDMTKLNKARTLMQKYKSLEAELAKLPKNQAAEAKKIVKKEEALFTVIKKQYISLITSGKGYSDTAKGYAEQNIHSLTL